MVSHDRFFLDRTAQIVYELEDRKLTKYPGNYTAYREKKRKDYELQKRPISASRRRLPGRRS